MHVLDKRVITLDPRILNRGPELKYDDLNQVERDKYIVKFLEKLEEDLVVTGKHRIDSWEDGWNENLQEFRQVRTQAALVPKYYNKSNYARYRDQIIHTYTPWFDYHLNATFVDAVLFPWLDKNPGRKVFEFGAGPAHNLLRIHEHFPKQQLVGLDWSKTSQQIIKEVGAAEITGHNFDFFNPNYDVDVNDGIVFTVAALEQVHNKFFSFLHYLVEKKPKICIHFEPIQEVLDGRYLLDNLSLRYMKKRNYLQGFLPALQKLEQDGKARIHDVRRLYAGSQFIEGHTIVIWEPTG